MFTKLEKTILVYPENEKKYMMELDKYNKVDLILMLNQINNQKDLKIIEHAITDIEKWRGVAVRRLDEISNAVDDIKEVLKKMEKHVYPFK